MISENTEPQRHGRFPRFSKTKHSCWFLPPPDTAYSLTPSLAPSFSRSLPPQRAVEASCLGPRAGFWGAVTCRCSAYQVPWVGWTNLRGRAEGPASASLWSSSAWPLPGALSVFPPLLCQAELVQPEPRCFPTLSLSRHLGCVPSCSPCHGCQGDAQGPAAPPAVHLQSLWLHQELLNWLCFPSGQPCPSLPRSLFFPSLCCGCDWKRHS